MTLGPFEFSGPVLTWTVIALTACFLTGMNLLQARRDRRAAEALGGKRLAVRVLTADGILRRDRIRFWMFLIWAALGFIASYIGFENTVRGTFIVTGLLTTAVLQLYSSYMDRRDRAKLKQEIDEYLLQEEARTVARYGSGQSGR